MEIISTRFVLFTLISLIIYHILPASSKKHWLLAVSIFFYYLYAVRFALVLSILVAVNYFIARQAYDSKNKSLTVIPLLLNIGSFFLIKVLNSNDFINTFSTGGFIIDKFILPIGFSYYILQLISIQLDIRNGRLIELPALSDFALYLFYFPKLLSGPIEKPRSFLSKINNPGIVDNKLFARAMNMIFLGLIRKMFIANILQAYVPDWADIFNPVGWIHALCFVLYVYNDFAGYTLIVCGVSCLFGIELSPNFSNPLLARSFSDFWNRWHITLSTWLRENIYYPVSRKLSRNTGKNHEVFAAYIIPPMLTLIASGFWHKASLALILWGIVLGVFMIIERYLFENLSGLKQFTQNGLGRIISSITIFILFSFAIVPLASNSINITFSVWSKLFSGAGFFVDRAFWPVVGLGSFSFLLDILAEWKGKPIWWEDMKLIPRSAIVSIGLMVLLISFLLIAFFPSRVFIYQGF